ncbi:hypothetical protein F5B19DRAFT_174689 [Rostrohypoxylon terebratum]|nr:hypothetical protein F5B19DRAFT_174689 [Rostrohypoxylon terebratum]
MAPEKANNGTNNPQESAICIGDCKILNSILKHCLPNAKPTSILWEGVCRELGFKNYRVGKDRFAQLCKKYHWFLAVKDDTASAESSPSKPKAAAHATDDFITDAATANSDADVTGASPTRKRKLDKTARASKKSKSPSKKPRNNIRRTPQKDYASDSDEA